MHLRCATAVALGLIAALAFQRYRLRLCVYSDLGETIADGTMEKRDCLPSLLEQKHISLFYCNSRKAILNPHQHGSETEFRRKFLVKLFSKSFGTRHLRQPLQPVRCVIGALWGVRDILKVLETCEGFKVGYRHHISRFRFMSFSHLVADSKCCALEF